MILYEFEVEYKEKEAPQPEGAEGEDYERKLGQKINKNLRALRLGESAVYAYIYAIDKHSFQMAVYAKAEMKIANIWKILQGKLSEVMQLNCALGKATEITAERFRSVIAEGDSNNILRNERRIMRELKLDYDENSTFKLSEELHMKAKLPEKKAIRMAEELMVATDYLEELQRIYSKDNMKKFFGHPVHYHLLAGSKESADKMLELLVSSLQNNNRLVGGRINYITELTERCYDEPDFENLIKNSQGGTVILPLNYGNDSDDDYASTYNEVIHFVGKLIKQYHRKTLFVFVEIISKKSYAKSMLNEISEELRLVQLSEGSGNREQAKAMFQKLIESSEYKCLRDAGDEEIIPEQDTYKLSEIYGYYDEWISRKIYHKAYKTYAVKQKVKVEEEKKTGTAYEKLQQMIGLNEVKDLVEQIISMHKLQKARFEMGMESERSAMHMIFAGNPGSAKTTVARLLTSILNEEGIIQNGKLVECGRADLVGKYVGWTAVQVKKKFKEAVGGVLFIDEAYSLVDDRSGSFGDEAINTIVQEMENHRSEVIVILAGYPEKMKQFLDKNEGLRSRIAFHLNFPDYDKTEMVDILKLMMKEKGYQCDAEVLEKCAEIFEHAVTQKEFGNARYARNLLEQAILRQSKRLMSSMAGKEISQEELQNLLPEDFEVLAVVGEKKEGRIGF